MIHTEKDRWVFRPSTPANPFAKSRTLLSSLFRQTGRRRRNMFWSMDCWAQKVQAPHICGFEESVFNDSTTFRTNQTQHRNNMEYQGTLCSFVGGRTGRPSSVLSNASVKKFQPSHAHFGIKTFSQFSDTILPFSFSGFKNQKREPQNKPPKTLSPKPATKNVHSKTSFRFLGLGSRS